MASALPGDGWNDVNYEIEGAPPEDPRKRPRAGAVIVSPSYFPVMEIRPKRGRLLTDLDGAAAPPAIVVNETFSRMGWPGQDPLGKRIRLYGRTGAALLPWMTVVGVIGDIVQNDESQGAHDPLIYIPYTQLPQRTMAVAARTVVPPESLGNLLRREVQTLDGDLPVTDLRTLDALLRERTRTWRVYGSMFAIFAGIALLLASVGLYAVVAHSVSQRTREIGVRMAMGATSGNIVSLIFAQSARQMIAGLAIGLAASFAVTQVLENMLVGVTPTDPLTLATVTAVLITAGIIGSAIPARRAMKVDPITALRHE
jgi:putative ABC transport system permease protein